MILKPAAGEGGKSWFVSVRRACLVPFSRDNLDNSFDLIKRGEGDSPKFQVTPSARRRGPQFVTEMGGVPLLIYAIICCLFQNTNSYRISFALQITSDTSLQPLRK